jgi:bacterioferritin (cytochrome b1)
MRLLGRTLHGFRCMNETVKSKVENDRKSESGRWPSVDSLEGCSERTTAQRRSPVNYDKLNAIHIGEDISKHLAYDHKAEIDAIAKYNKGIELSVKLSDNGTRELLEDILREEEEHIDWIEAQQDQIEQIGVQNYLVEQID